MGECGSKVDFTSFCRQSVSLTRGHLEAVGTDLSEMMMAVASGLVIETSA